MWKEASRASHTSSRGRRWGRAGRLLPLVGLAVALGLVAGCQPAGGPGAAQAGASGAADVALAASEAASVASAALAASAASAVAEGASAASAAAMRLRGIYTWGSEVETLAPCNSNKTYWLEGDEELLAPLQDLAIRQADAANEAYQPIYVEVLVRDAGRATDGLAVDYDGLMQLQAVQAASAQVPADCKLLDWPGLPIADDASDANDAADAATQGPGK